MATKEPVRRCVRCKTKKKGCSRGNPCERCALAGLGPDECIYLESDATFRSIKPKKIKEPSAHAPVSNTVKVSKATVHAAPDPNVIVRCSRCIRTARGCSHERPCQPCREHGLSEWECRYTSASSFKVRGPGAKDLRKMKSLERIPVSTDLLDDMANMAAITPKQGRSYSTNSVLDGRSKLMLSQIPQDYRTPSPPTNISPISEPANYRDRSESKSPSVQRTTPRQPESVAVPIPGSKPKFVATLDSTSSDLSRQNSAYGLFNSVEPPPMVSLISQQSHANTIPESSPAVYTDDYQSSPSPFNSPQFQSSPPVHFQAIDGSHRITPNPGETSMFAPQIPYRPPAGYAMQGQARQYAAAQAQHGFVTIPSPQNSLPFQQLNAFSHSPPYSQQQLQMQQQYLSQGYAVTGSPRHRTIPNPSPRFASPGPYAIPARPGSYQNSLMVNDARVQGMMTPQGIPIRRKAQTPYGSYSSHGASPRDNVEVDQALIEFKNNLTRQASQNASTSQAPQSQQGDEESMDAWQDDLGVFAEQVMND